MQEDNPIYILPEYDTQTLLIIALVLTLILATAIAFEVLRRTKARRRRIAADWVAVNDIIREHELSPDEADHLKQLIQRHRPLEPLRAVTVRYEFDDCVAAEMGALQNEATADEYSRQARRLRDIRVQLGLDFVPFGQRITSTRELYPGQWISLARPAENAWTRMMVDDVDEASFLVSLRRSPNDPMPGFRPGDEVRCRLWRDEDARYLFATKVASSGDPARSYRLEHTQQLSRTQARNHFRVRYDQGTPIGILNASVDGNEKKIASRKEVTRMRGRITSLSAGGCALVLQQEIARQVVLRIQLEIEGEPPIPLEAKIVSIAPISGGRVLVRASFVNLDDDRRDKVAKFVLSRQQHILAARESAT